MFKVRTSRMKGLGTKSANDSVSRGMKTPELCLNISHYPPCNDSGLDNSVSKVCFCAAAASTLSYSPFCCRSITSHVVPLSLRSLRCVHGREHHVSRWDWGGDGSYSAPQGGSGAPGVRAALHVSPWSLVKLFMPGIKAEILGLTIRIRHTEWMSIFYIQSMGKQSTIYYNHLQTKGDKITTSGSKGTGA